MKRIYKTTLVIAILIFGFGNTVQSQVFSDVLETVYLTKASQASIINMSYDDLNNDLFTMTDINFSREIRVAKKEKTIISINENTTLPKATYLKVLRNAANTTDNIDDFYKKVNKKIPVLNKASIKETDLSKLYITVKANTLHGKLDAVGSQLTWL